MQVCYGLEEFRPPAGGVVLTVGNFDGVHRGHAALIRRARHEADRAGLPVVAVTFDPHPLAILTPQRAPRPLTTLPEKLELLSACGADAAIVLRSDPELLGMSAEAFLERLVACCRPRAFVEGPTFRFGRARRGTLETLREHAARYAYTLHTVETVRCTELPQAPAISSSAVRGALAEGRVQDAAAMLGRPHRVTGQVGGGAGRGAALGIPTANLEQIPQMVPRDGVYAAAAQLEDRGLHLAAVNAGPQPTFGQQRSQVEAHLLDFRGSLHGRRIGLHFLARLRDQQRFGGPEELVEQIRRDIEAVRRLSGELERVRDGPILSLG